MATASCIYLTGAEYGGTWPRWVQSWEGQMVDAATTSCPWPQWVVTGTTRDTTLNDYYYYQQKMVWAQWTKDGWVIVDRNGLINPQPVRAPTPQELEERRLQGERAREMEIADQVAWVAAEKKQIEEAKEARKRAQALLFRELSRVQRKEYKKNKHITVVGSDGVNYRIREGWAGNVEELNKEGKTVARYCIHPRESIPLEDNVLGQKLWLEADAVTFKRTANRTPVAA